VLASGPLQLSFSALVQTSRYATGNNKTKYCGWQQYLL